MSAETTDAGVAGIGDTGCKSSRDSSVNCVAAGAENLLSDRHGFD
jgi:hypothetical protein